MAPRSAIRAQLRFEWVETSLAALAALEEGHVAQVRVRGLAREIVSVCRMNRERVIRAEALLDEYRDVISVDQKNEVLRLMAEVLLYVQSGGIRLRVTDDPRATLEDIA